MPLYHYTDRVSLASIRREGVIRASRQTCYRDVDGAHGGGPSHTTEPIVWLTINPIIEATVMVKLALAGWPKGLVGDLGRVVLPDLYAADIGLWEYTQQAKIDPEWWQWVIRSGALIGSHYTCWRIVPRDVPAADFLGLEILAGYADSGTTWAPFAP